MVDVTVPLPVQMQATANNLQIALAFLKWHPQARLFPCSRYEDGQHKALVKWSQASSSDTTQVRAWGQQHPGCYFCLDAVRSPYTVLDPDDKTGRDGNATLAALEAQHGALPSTLGSKTPSGKGRHLLFRCSQKLKTGADRLGVGLDIPVMVPLPGQYVPGKGLYALTGGPQCTKLPRWVAELAGRASDKKAGENLNVPAPGVIVDNEPRVIEAMLYALHNAPGVSAGRRDRTAFDVAQTIRDFGLSFQTTLRIMRDVWAARPDVEIIDQQNLADKVRSAYTYSRSRLGEKLPEAVFAPIPVPPLELYEDADELPSTGPSWLVEDYIPRTGVTLLFGESNVFKSFLAIDLAYRVAAGLPWCGQDVVQGPALYIAGEGASGLRARGLAWKRHHAVKEKLPVFFRTIPAAFGQPQSVAEIKRFVQVIEERRGPLALLIVDTLAANFGAGDESSNRDMGMFLSGLNEATGHRGARLLIHHSGQKERERERGAYALRAGLDAIYQLKRVETGKAPGCFLRCDKMRDSEFSEPRAFSTVWVPLGYDAGGKLVASIVLEEIPASSVAVVPAKPLTEKQVAILDAIRAQSVPGQGAAIEDVVKAVVDLKAYSRAEKAKQAIKYLADHRHILMNGERIRCVGF